MEAPFLVRAVASLSASLGAKLVGRSRRIGIGYQVSAVMSALTGIIHRVIFEVTREAPSCSLSH
jgi:hypothetical protein